MIEEKEDVEKEARKFICFLEKEERSGMLLTD